MKKTIMVLIVLVLTLNFVSAAPREVTVTLDDNEVMFPDQKPIIENSRTLVPVRFVSEALGAKVDWIQAEQKVVITKDSKKIELVVGQKKVKIDNKDITLDVASKSQNDRTLVPLRFISEAFGCQVDWDQENWIVIIKTSSSTPIAQKLDNAELQKVVDNVPGLVVPEKRRGDIVLYAEEGEATLYNSQLYIIPYDSMITINLDIADSKTLDITRKILQQYYPRGYQEAYNYFLDTVNNDTKYKDKVIDGITYGSSKFDDGYVIYVGVKK